MHIQKINAFKTKFLGRDLAGYHIVEFINNGKSAVVFKAEKNGEIVAVKIFDPELISTLSDGTQEKRIEREITLRGQKHPCLIEILDGGRKRI